MHKYKIEKNCQGISDKAVERWLE